MSVARLIARFATETEIRVVIATPRDDLADALAPRERVAFDPLGRLHIERIWETLVAGAVPIRITRGSPDDYAALAPLHYRAGPPATLDLVLVARDTRADQLAGALIVSRPTLNGAWRDVAWPGRFTSGRPKANALCLNAELRCISRVVVDPRYRSLGIARAMVRAYLDRPLTPCTEAVAAMGAACPFFAAAGMHEIETPPAERDKRLLGVLSSAGMEPWRLAMPRAAWARVERGERREDVERALRVWANASRASRKALDGPIEALFAKACAGVASRRVAYVWDREWGGGGVRK
jgi:GNAT superfamily N-acetyltransferase